MFAPFEQYTTMRFVRDGRGRLPSVEPFSTYINKWLDATPTVEDNVLLLRCSIGDITFLSSVYICIPYSLMTEILCRANT